MRLFLSNKFMSVITISTSLITVIILIKSEEKQWIVFVTKFHVLKKTTSFTVRRLNPNLLSQYCCLLSEILELSSPITSSPKSSSPQAFLRNLLRCNRPKSSSLLSFSSLWLSYFSFTADLYMQLWLSYFPPISKNLAIRNVHSE